MTVRDTAKREKKRAIRGFADEYIQAHHMSPSMSEIGEALGIMFGSGINSHRVPG